jgi:probable rRNA maturation factor
LAIFFHDEEINSGLNKKQAIKSWFNRVLEIENAKTGRINIILTNDEYLREINRRYLSRNCYTDIITFDYSESRTISGDLFISIDRVKDNAKKYREPFDKELLRVMVHGLLHLMGYSDRDAKEKEKMRTLEDKYLELYSHFL